MSVQFKRQALRDGVFFTSAVDSRFKTNRIMVNMTLPLEQDTASRNALLPFLLKRGYKRYPDYTQLNRRLNELYGASLGASVGKTGDFQILTLSLSGIDDRFALQDEPLVQEFADILCELLLEPIFLEPSFEPSALEVEKQGLIDLIEAEFNEKSAYAIRRLEALMCADEPFGLDKYGTPERIRTITLEEMKETYQDVLKSARIEVFFVGCGNPENASRLFAKKLKNAGSSFSLQSVVVPAFGEAKRVEEAFQVSQAKLAMGFRVAVNTPQEQAAARLMATVFGGTPRALLFTNAREKLSLCYYCYARYNSSKNIMMVNSGVEFENVDKARDEILVQLETLKKGDFDDRLVEETKLMLADSFRTVNDTTGGIAGWYLEQVFRDSQNTPEQEAEILCAVTREEIIAAANAVTLDTIYVLKGGEADA